MEKNTKLKNNINKLCMLISLGIQIATGSLTEVEREEKTPLHWASFQGDLHSVRARLEAGDDKDAQCRNGLTALHLAVVAGHKEVVDILVKAGANKELSDESGLTPLDLAVCSGNESIIATLLKVVSDKVVRSDEGGKIGNLGLKPIHFAGVCHKDCVSR